MATFVRSTKDVLRVAGHSAFPEKDLRRDGAVDNVAFLKGPLARTEITVLKSVQSPVDSFRVNKSEVYWLRQRSEGETQFSNAVLEKTLKIEATIRNLNTVRKIAARLA